MNNIFKNKKKGTIRGFTLIELLAVLAVSSIVLSIVVYSIISIVGSLKNKSYQVTIDNIQTTASNYLIEDISAGKWIDNVDNTQYQCVTIQNLIDGGYFKNDILDSMIGENEFVEADDFVYVERNTINKNITKSILLAGNRSEYNGLCNNMNPTGSISFILSPDGWSEEKTIDIKYLLYNYDDISSYKYEYSYIYSDDTVGETNSGVFVISSEFESVNVNKNGTMIAKILDKNNNEIVSETLLVNQIDDGPPICTLSVTKDGITIVTSSTDVVSSWLSTSSDATEGSDILSLSAGTKYGFVKDDSGNVGMCSVNIESSIRNASVSCNASNYGYERKSCPSGYPYYYDSNCSKVYVYTIYYKRCQKVNGKWDWVESGNEPGNETCEVNLNPPTCNSNTNLPIIYKCGKDETGRYSGTIYCYNNYCSNGYTRITNTTYCYK